MTRELLNLDQITAEKITINGATITASIAKYDGLNAIFTIIYNDTAPTSRAVASTTGDTESARRQGDRLLYYMNGGKA